MYTPPEVLSEILLTQLDNLEEKGMEKEDKGSRIHAARGPQWDAAQAGWRRPCGGSGRGGSPWG